jgi:hypothetical protein
MEKKRKMKKNETHADACRDFHASKSWHVHGMQAHQRGMPPCLAWEKMKHAAAHVPRNQNGIR